MAFASSPIAHQTANYSEIQWHNPPKMAQGSLRRLWAHFSSIITAVVASVLVETQCWGGLNYGKSQRRNGMQVSVYKIHNWWHQQEAATF